MSRRTGFTLIELLVVIAIMAILVALLLPAVQQAREAAHRMQCKNNLLQIGFAVHSYQASHEVFPPGVVNLTGPIEQFPEGYHHGWLISILPYIEAPNLFSAIDPTLSIYAEKNLTARKTVISTYLCPSQSTARNAVPENHGVALSSYAGNHHPVAAPIDVNNHGVLFLNSRTAYNDIYDGTASTILAGEAIRNPQDLGWASGTRSSLRNGGAAINETPEGSRYYNDLTAIATGQKSRDSVDWNTQKDFGNGGYGGGYGAGYSGYGGYGTDEAEDEGSMGAEEAEAPVRPPEPELPASYAFDPGGFGSHHPGGAQFLLCDGSVRFLSENITSLVYRNLLDRADGQNIDEF
ncbi:Type II secretion system protein G precursor [Thalassoglobus neptunius]|uniref:Type II secretion system protein G n=1 Tax=Thalassoglobus neptunius TaxID=1938619 RepID=A0A5C5X886_9PLAN|nr:DUF1559 domain-containing protein [Thalassoglobus neptunius]TWT58355.1 Type II secretion system protein G precursor [Thalassoglobus neptunius]